jgi:multidrug efflux system outer membrane protein
MRASFKTLVASGLAAGLLAGCATLEPTYHRPTLPTPAAFPQATLDDLAAPAGGKIGWQAFFVDPKLRQLIALGLANNRDLRVAVANVEAARAKYHVQRADLLPSINASLGATYGHQQVITGTPTNPNTAPLTYEEHQYTTNVGFSSYELDLFGRVRSLTKSSLEQYFSTREAQRAAQITLIAEIADDDLTLAADSAILKTAQDTLTSASASLDLAQKRFDHGVASQLDVAQARTLVEQARSDVANDTTIVAQDRDALDFVVGSPVPDALLPDALDDQLPVMSDVPAGLPSDVLLSRPDVLEAEHQLKAENAQIGAARAAFFPTITLTGSGGTTSTDLTNLFKGPFAIWSFAPQVSVPIFNGGANIANLDYAKAERTVAVAQYEKAIQSAFKDVADALARRATIDEQLAAQQAGVDAAADAARLSRARYERGSDTYLNVLTAERTLYSAQETLIAARLTRATNLVSLYTALGGGA